MDSEILVSCYRRVELPHLRSLWGMFLAPWAGVWYSESRKTGFEVNLRITFACRFSGWLEDCSNLSHVKWEITPCAPHSCLDASGPASEFGIAAAFVRAVKAAASNRPRNFIPTKFRLDIIELLSRKWVWKIWDCVLRLSLEEILLFIPLSWASSAVEGERRYHTSSHIRWRICSASAIYSIPSIKTFSIVVHDMAFIYKTWLIDAYTTTRER